MHAHAHAHVHVHVSIYQFTSFSDVCSDHHLQICGRQGHVSALLFQDVVTATGTGTFPFHGGRREYDTETQG